MRCVFSRHFQMVWVLDLGYEPLKSQSKNPHFIFCFVFKIFVWDHKCSEQKMAQFRPHDWTKELAYVSTQIQAKFTWTLKWFKGIWVFLARCEYLIHTRLGGREIAQLFGRHMAHCSTSSTWRFRSCMLPWDSWSTEDLHIGPAHAGLGKDLTTLHAYWAVCCISSFATPSNIVV